MAKLTTARQNSLWISRTLSDFCFSDDAVQDESTFHCYKFRSVLDGGLYYVSLIPSEIPFNANEASVESAVKAKLALMDYKPKNKTSSISI